MRAINEMVDELRDQDGRGWMPYVAPWHGGVEARVLCVLRDPGPKTQEGTGSGFLCVENDDATAERQCTGFAEAGIEARDTMPWNAYPWYINRAPNAEERRAGVTILARLLGLLPRLEVVLLQGVDAQDSWRRLERTHPQFIQQSGYQVVSTYHPSRQALWSPDPDVRAAREQQRLDSYRRVAKLLQR
ncbi:uracil-DNA glycosylase [Streptomyces sp. NPDC020898]|uniref:uracil-DNA glycosylase n=1 Tax=Streptomyces sp. NPDC020898 TaxID=3365101 RepID=UPI00378DC506